MPNTFLDGFYEAVLEVAKRNSWRRSTLRIAASGTARSLYLKGV